MSEIITEYWAKPIPVRHYDWQAVRADGDDENPTIGYGKTEEEAIENLKNTEYDDLSDDLYDILESFDKNEIHIHKAIDKILEEFKKYSDD